MKKHIIAQRLYVSRYGADKLLSCLTYYSTYAWPLGKGYYEEGYCSTETVCLKIWDRQIVELVIMKKDTIAQRLYVSRYGAEQLLSCLTSVRAWPLDKGYYEEGYYSTETVCLKIWGRTIVELLDLL